MAPDDDTPRENADAVVRSQYEAHPYPPRDPDDERQRLITGSPSHIREINHYVFGGKRDFSKPFRALIAGGGTGDATVMLAQQLADQGPGEVVYVDISEASLKIAEARVQARNLRNVSFHHGSLLDLGDIAPGPYDYIDCCGVLHHLADPAAALGALEEVLEENGGMGLMLYGALGRTGVYPMQEAIRELTMGMEGGDRLALARRLVDSLPDSNWLKKNPAVGDHLLDDDAAFTDLLLHSRDRAYTVPEIDALMSGFGFTITGFIEPVRYDPATYLDEEALVGRARDLPWMDQCAIAESIAGNLKTHVFYVVPSSHGTTALAQADNPGMVPLWRDDDGPAFARRLSGSSRIKMNFDGLALSLELPDGAGKVAELINGERSLGDIQAALYQDWITFKARFDRLYRVLNGLNLMLLKAG
tara:strand:- start:3676 stop:4926 length:1251 start_codon:yes stop_codon:yes gene_type:complete